MTVDDPRKEYYRIFMGIVIIGSAAGYVFASRYMRDMNQISKQITQTTLPTTKKFANPPLDLRYHRRRR